MRLLLVEDSPADVLLVREALRTAGVEHELEVVGDGEAALDVLRGAATDPDLVLLDLNLPRKDGREVLSEVKSDPGLRHIPVIVLTTSTAPEDVRSAYDNHVNAYIRKPLGIGALAEMAAAIRDFWLGTATLPGQA